MRRGSVGLLLFALAMATVLRGGTDIKNQAFVSCVAIDPAENGKLLVSIQIPANQGDGFKGASGSDGNGAGGSAEQSTIVEAIAFQFIDATEVLNASIPRELNYSQVLQILIAEEIAKDGRFTSLLDDIMRLRDIRSSAAIVICRGKAQDILMFQKPILSERLASNIATQMTIAQEMGIIPDTNMGELLRLCHGAWRDAIVPYSSLNMESELYPNSENEEEGIPLDRPAGDMPFSIGDNSVDYIGAVLLLDGRMIGSLTGMEMRLLTFVMGKSREFTYFVDDVYLRVHQTRPASIRVIQGESGWIIRVGGRIHANVLQLGVTSEERIRDALTYQILSLLRKLQAYGVDPAGFEGKAIRNVLAITDWPHDRWIEGYQNATIEVSIHVTVGEIR